MSREIAFLLSKVFLVMQSIALIRWPADFHYHLFERVVGAIDCTTHLRHRVHPRQADWYRCDKHAFFITAQIVCSTQGDCIYQVTLGQGHNNDKGMLILSGLKGRLLEWAVKLLGDRGYAAHTCVIPDDNKPIEWNNRQKGLRSVVETVGGLAQTFGAARTTFRGTPELQQVALMTVYHIAQHYIQTFPLRTHD